MKQGRRGFLAAVVVMPLTLYGTGHAATPQLPVTSELCVRGGGHVLPDMKPGTLFCNKGDFNGAPVVDVKQGGGKSGGESVKPAGEGDEASSQPRPGHPKRGY